MAELISVGLDVGTTTTQLVVSRLEVENAASGFAVPEMVISRRQVVYESPVYFTPLLTGELVDGKKIREIVDREYRAAGITREQVDTGAIIITGETSRKENAAAVLETLGAYAGEFVVATAGPDLESVLAAKGAGAVELSREVRQPVLHMDIGGGTSNLCLLENGAVTATACWNVGGRLLRLDDAGRVLWTSPVLGNWGLPGQGERMTEEALERVAARLTQVLEMAAGLRQPEAWMEALRTKGSGHLPAKLPDKLMLSFSGGVADCIGSRKPWLAYGDMGPVLGQCIRNSRLCAGAFRLGTQTIRATVIGAGCHSTALSGSTVYCRNVALPIQNLPVVQVSACRQELLEPVLRRQEGPCVLAFSGEENPGYGEICRMADTLSRVGGKQMYLAMEADFAKALGQALALRRPDAQILSIDRVRLPENCYLDVGKFVGPALPVVIKTLILSREG